VLVVEVEEDQVILILQE
jgi:hypothetical protein